MKAKPRASLFKHTPFRWYVFGAGEAALMGTVFSLASMRLP